MTAVSPHPAAATLPHPGHGTPGAELPLGDAAFLRSVEARLGGFFLDQRARAEGFDPEYGALWDSLARAASGGKRLRPLLAHHAHAALGGRRPEALLETGIALELLHTAFVVHDDIIDGDVQRRGAPNVTGTFLADPLSANGTPARARHRAEAAALIGGDLLLTQAQRVLGRAPLEEHLRERLLDLFERAVYVTAAGELADVSLGFDTGQRAGLESALTMSERKTAEYSFAAPLRMGALLADAPEETAAAAAEFGRHLGIAYQLRDDELGVFGDPRVTGKSVVSDLREGKNTAMAILARGGRAGPLIEAARGREDLGAGELEEIRRALEADGARARLREITAGYAASAEAALRSSAVPPTLRRRLRTLLAALSERTS